MGTHVERLVSEVVPEPEGPAPAPTAGESLPADALRRRLRRLERIEARTRARDFED